MQPCGFRGAFLLLPMKHHPSRFNKEIYHISDGYSKQVFSQFLKEKGHQIVSIEEDYTFDIITRKNNKTYYFELETKTGVPWTSKNDFRYETVSFLGRKIRLHAIRQFFYVIICRETGSALCCRSDIIYLPEHKEELDINSQYRMGKDVFYRVSIDRCVFFQIK